MPESAAAPSPEALARPHLYDYERVIWAGRQPVLRTSIVRWVAAGPGFLLTWGAVTLLVHTLETAPEALRGPEEGYAMHVLIASMFLGGLTWLWGTVYRPFSAYREVRSVWAVLTEHRLLWVEELSTGETRVRHPFRWGILRPGGLRYLAVFEQRGGGGRIRLTGGSAAGPRNATVRIPPGEGPSAQEVGALLCRTLEVEQVPPERFLRLLERRRA